MNLSQSWRRRLPVLIAFGVAVMVALSFMVAHSQFADADHDASHPHPSDSLGAEGEIAMPPAGNRPVTPPGEVEPVGSDVAGTRLPPLPETANPDVYAEAVAQVLFGMDHANNRPADYEALFADALWDEIGTNDQARIMATISRRIPTADMWEQMRSVEQAEEFTVELVWEPRSARNYRARGDWPDGWEMRTVSGTQTETWRAPGEQAQSSTRPVAVTVAMACPPAASPCRLIGILPHVES